MISILGSTFSVLYPLVLAVAVPVALGALMYAYRRRGQGKKQKVATLHILRLLENMPRVRRRFFPPLRFFFELLTVLLICLAASGLYRDEDAQHVVYLVDNSFSTAAAAGWVDQNVNVISKIKEALSGDLEKLSSGANVEVYLTSPILRSLSDVALSPEGALKLVPKIEFAYAGDSIDGALQRLALESPSAKIRVFTDKAKGNLATGRTSADNITISTVAEKSSLDNLAVSDISAGEDALGESGRRIDVTVTSYSNEPSQLSLALEGIYKGKEPPSYVKIAERQIALKPNARVTESFTGVESGVEAFKASINAVRKSGSSSVDVILQDNAAYLSNEAKSSQTLLVSDLDVRSLGLHLLKGAAVESIRPEQYDDYLAKGRLSQYRMFIFHRFVPRSFPQGNLLFVVPESRAGQFEMLESRSDAAVTRWLPSHPLLSYMNVSILKFKKLTPLKVPPWAEEIIATSGGAAAFAGERDKRRIAVLGFELFPFEARRSPTLSILTLNLFKWLSDLSSSGNYFSAAGVLPITPETSKISYLSGEEVFNRLKNDPAGEFRAEHPGLVMITNLRGESTFQAVNFFNSDESNLLTKADVTIPVSRSESETDVKPADTWIRWLLYAVCLLISLELLFFFLSPLFSLRRRAGVTS